MAHFYEYLEFNSDEDRENQLEVYVEVKLSTDTEEKLQAVGVQGDWLVMAEPYCPIVWKLWLISSEWQSSILTLR